MERDGEIKYLAATKSVQMIKKSDDISEIIPAFIKAKHNFTPAHLDMDNKFSNYKYASLKSVYECCESALMEQDIVIVHGINTADNGISVSTRLWHSSGQWIETSAGFPEVENKKMNKVQEAGTVITYGKRYTLSCFGIITETDTDGVSPGGKKSKAKSVPVKKKTTKKKKSNGNNYKFLKAVQEKKKLLNEYTGNDDLYYKVVGNFGVEKSLEIKDREQQIQFFNALEENIDILAEDKQADLLGDTDED